MSKRLDLVYGGGSIGLMGLVSQAVHCGGHVLGYIYNIYIHTHTVDILYIIFTCIIRYT